MSSKFPGRAAGSSWNTASPVKSLLERVTYNIFSAGVYCFKKDSLLMNTFILYNYITISLMNILLMNINYTIITITYINVIRNINRIGSVKTCIRCIGTCTSFRDINFVTAVFNL